jgi:hypothetical protein
MVVRSASPLESEHQQVLIHPELSVTGERIVVRAGGFAILHFFSGGGRRYGQLADR